MTEIKHVVNYKPDLNDMTDRIINIIKEQKDLIITSFSFDTIRVIDNQPLKINVVVSIND